VDTTDRDVRLLRQRVERLERLVVQAVCAVAGLALVIGAFLDYLPVKPGAEEDDLMSRLAVVGFEAIRYRDDEGHVDGFGIVVGIGFLGLLLVTVVVLWLLGVIASTSSATKRTGPVFRVAVTLLLIGTAVAGLFALVGLGSDEIEVGWGVVVFAGGGLLSLLLLHDELRGWWDPRAR
jgi:hypothetical protein